MDFPQLREKWSILAEVGFELDEFWENSSETRSTRGREINISEEKIEKIIDWLEVNGIKEGSPKEFFSGDEDRTKRMIALKEKLRSEGNELFSRRALNKKDLKIKLDFPIKTKGS